MTAAPNLRVLIIDDEPLARQRIADLVAHEQGVEIAGTADNGTVAVEAIRRLRPDIVFLDVQMPGMTGLDVARTIGVDAMPATIFVTAFDQHALKAFDLAALDYLVKPFDDERFEQAFQRARRLTSLQETQRLHERLLSVLQASPASAPPIDERSSIDSPSFLQRIPVESRGKVKFIPVADIDYIAASGPYAELVVGTRRYLIREAMQALEERLDPARFFRIHRSAIVPLDRVDTLHKGAGGDYEVQLKSGTRLRVSRSRREALEQRLGLA
jgi:two-component system, LytTR family, response regulator